jgi:hypothetical protein
MPGYLGSGQTNGKIIYVPIPKNASSAHNGMLKGEGWQRIFFHSEIAHQPAYIPVRHPVDRWYSGAAQFERRRGGEDLDVMIAQVKEGRNPVYDEHTFRQSDYVLSSLQNVILVRLEHAIAWCKDNLGLTLPRVRGRVTKPNDPELNPILEKFYADDIKLYESAI